LSIDSPSSSQQSHEHHRSDEEEEEFDENGNPIEPSNEGDSGTEVESSDVE